ncbi:MAG: anaerobic sulfatase-maturation protein [Duncaniella sp.]|nr:anaerobic sulfatase-maturation protein [Muribaculum sp.]MCM1255725.1 anaerobic sulfatase-maturation protein [Duncaniella sp.]
MAKPAGAMCNLSCEYCYYLDKNNVVAPGNLSQYMSEEVLETFIRKYIASQPQENILFIWHGGETLLRKRSFYEHALELQAKYAEGHKIDNCIQTNGLLLTDDWCRFFHDNNFLVGVSIDGPGRFHDEYRRDKFAHPTFLKVLKGIQLLNKHDVEWNAMAVVNDYNSHHPMEFYRFFRDKLGCRFLQFAPIVERFHGQEFASPDIVEGSLAPFSVEPERWGNFLCEIFDEWVRHDVGEMFVQIFDATLANWVGVTPAVCTLAPKCGTSPVIEHNGNIYMCDHFVYPDYLIGNVTDIEYTKLLSRQIEFGNKKRTTLPHKCLECKYLFACNGECPKNRIIQTETEGHRLNYLCDGYFKFFQHVAPYMEIMKEEYLNGRPPSNIMNILKSHSGH